MNGEPLPLTRLVLLLEQYDTSYEMLHDRLKGLTDEEYFWEPAPRCWSVRRRAEAVSPNPIGKGEWVLDFAAGDVEPAPVTTLAWRLCHLFEGQRQRYDYTFGSKSLGRHDVNLPGTAAEALAWMEESHRAWRAGLGELSDSDLDIVGLSSYPDGLDPQLPFGSIVWWTNRELIHHGGEIGVLRDLWAWRDPAGS